MYYSNREISSNSYNSMHRAVYSNFQPAPQTITPIYQDFQRQENIYQKKEEEKKYEPKKSTLEMPDVVMVDDMQFDLFLKFSPLLRSLESKEVKQIYTDFLKNNGKLLLKFLKEKGLKFIDLVGFAKMKLDKNAVAAVVRTGRRAILAVNTNFNEQVLSFSKTHKLSIKEALLYVMCHETVHLADIHSEEETEKIVGDFFKHLNNKDYNLLASVAYERSREAKT